MNLAFSLCFASNIFILLITKSTDQGRVDRGYQGKNALLLAAGIADCSLASSVFLALLECSAACLGIQELEPVLDEREGVDAFLRHLQLEFHRHNHHHPLRDRCQDVEEPDQDLVFLDRTGFLLPHLEVLHQSHQDRLVRLVLRVVEVRNLLSQNLVRGLLLAFIFITN